jgi:cytochrome c553
MTGHSRDPRFATWIVATVVLFLAAGGVGFVWLPSAQPDASGLGLWNLICRAVGLPARGVGGSAPAGSQPSSTVAWTAATRELLTRGDAARGAALATTCNNCHGANGVSADAAFPNLAGQNVAALYKQLEDFRSRKRDATVMGVFVDPLSQEDVLNLATYFASLRNPFAANTEPPGSLDANVRHLIVAGDPMRGIAPCAACHGPVGLTPGAPGLRGQQRAYLEEQMQAFKTGRRHNDISQQMRSVARQLTEAEIAALAAYYSGIPGVMGRLRPEPQLLTEAPTP